jgi:hypothetical protein
MKTKVLIAGLAAAAALMAQPPGGPGPRGRGGMGFGPGGHEGPGGPQPVVTGVPYSAVEVHSFQQVLANGNTIQHQQNVNIYRDAQGRVRRETTRTTPDGKTVSHITISDPVAGVVHELDAANKTSFDHPLQQPGPNGGKHGKGGPGPNGAAPRNGGQTARFNPGNDPNVKRETLAAQPINGLTASGTRVTRTIPAGEIGNTQAIQTVHETWFSEELKVPVQSRITDPRNGTTTMQLTNIQRTAPDSSLFAVPADYTVKTGGPGGPGGPRGRGQHAPGAPPNNQ